MNTSQYQGYSPTAKFPSISNKEMKEMIDYMLDQRKFLSDGISLVGQISNFVPGHEITFGIIYKVLEYISEEELFREKLLERKIDRAIVKFAINTMKAEIEVIEIHIKRMEDINLALDERKIEVPVVLSSCRKILNLFNNKEHIYYTHPLTASPFLIAFSQLYIIICKYGIELLPTYKGIIEDEKKRLKEVIEDYKMNTIKERLEMIKVIRMMKVPYYEGSIKDDMIKLVSPGSFGNILNNLKEDAKLLKLHDVDIVKDGFGFDSKHDKLHYWDRTYWDQKQQCSDNYEYSMLVKITYEQYFNDVIGAIY